MARKASIDKSNTINIKSVPVQAHIGASRFSNDDWKTIAFSFPRTDLALKFSDKELRYNCIYFLFGYEDGHEAVYVGQALKRADGESVLARLREHDKSNTEKYRDKWNWVVAVTNEDDTWGSTELDALEIIFIEEVPKEYSLNGRSQNNAGANISLYDDKVTQIKALITSIGFKVFEDIPETEKIQVTSVVNDYSIVEDLQNGMARIPEIVTPDRVVKAMLDMLPAEVWNSKTTFLDPACKGGEYLRAIYDRLMDNETMQSEFPDERERHTHILKNQIFGIALSQVSLERTTKKLLGEDRNIKVIPNYIEVLKALPKVSKETQEKNHIDMQSILNERFGREMKFDVVIGNPPYSEESGGGGRTARQGATLYHRFIELGLNIADITCMITKNNWLSSDTLSDIRNKMIKTGIVEINNYPLYGEVFKGVSVSVASFIVKKGYEKESSYNEIKNGKIVSTYTQSLKDMICIPDCKEMISIVKKTACDNYFDKFVYSKMPFGIASDGKIGATGKGAYIDTSLVETDYYNTPILFNDGYVYMHDEDIPKNSNIRNHYKIACGQQLRHDDKVIYNMKGINAGSITSQSFAILYNSEDKKHAYNCYKYLQSKFARILVRCITDEICTTSPIRFQLLPLQDFTSASDIDWSKSVAEIDQQLYKKYRLTQEEIDYIEKTIKPME